MSKKIKIIDNKVKQNKTKDNLDRRTAKNSDNSPENASKYEFLTGEDIFLQNEMLKLFQSKYLHALF